MAFKYVCITQESTSYIRKKPPLSLDPCCPWYLIFGEPYLGPEEASTTSKSAVRWSSWGWWTEEGSFSSDTKCKDTNFLKMETLTLADSTNRRKQFHQYFSAAFLQLKYFQQWRHIILRKSEQDYWPYFPLYWPCGLTSICKNKRVSKIGHQTRYFLMFENVKARKIIYQPKKNLIW